MQRHEIISSKSQATYSFGLSKTAQTSSALLHLLCVCFLSANKRDHSLIMRKNDRKDEDGVDVCNGLAVHYTIFRF